MRFLFAFFLMGSLIACTETSKVKDVALVAAQDRLEKKIRKEVDEKVTGKSNLVKIYVRSILQRSDFEVDDVTLTPPSATALVRVRTVPQSVRFAMVDILARLAPSKENVFNVSDAIQETMKVMNKDLEERTESKERIELRKNDGWQALPENP